MGERGGSCSCLCNSCYLIQELSLVISRDLFVQYYLLRKKQLESGITDSIAHFLIPNLAKIESKAYAPGMPTSHLAFIQTLLRENFQLWLVCIC